VKLDMLGKMGRNVNHFVVEDDDGYHHDYHQKHEQYKSMQLIEE